MKKINPYLNFNGNTEEAFNFYKSVFDGEFLMIHRFKDTPEAGTTEAKDKDKIMHISLAIGKQNILMGTDALESKGHKVSAGNNFHLSINTDSEDETRTLFKRLSEGGTITVPLDKMFWGDYFGMCTDKFGIQWMVTYSYPKNN